MVPWFGGSMVVPFGQAVAATGPGLAAAVAAES